LKFRLRVRLKRWND